MKTIKTILTVLATIFMVSCSSTYYKMVTTLDRSGNIYREIYALGDSAFMSGNTSRNPFLFDLSSDWSINRYDTAFNYDFFGNNKKLNVKISKKANSIEDYSKDIRCGEDERSLAAPEESLTKKTGWFYTNYTLKIVYKKLQYKAPIPIDDYLSKEEQIIWTQGGLCNYKIMNGIEMSDYLGGINDKFTEWFARNRFEISLECIKKLTEKYDLEKNKESIYTKMTTDSVKADAMNVNPIDINPKAVCDVLDSFYKTTYFSKLYHINNEILDKDFNQTLSVIDITTNVISYEFVIPGEILQTNAPVFHSDTLVWKVNGMRLLLDDYLLKAEYRVINKWAFLLTGLLIIIAIGSIIILAKRRKKM